MPGPAHPYLPLLGSPPPPSQTNYENGMFVNGSSDDTGSKQPKAIQVPSSIGYKLTLKSEASSRYAFSMSINLEVK